MQSVTRSWLLFAELVRRFGSEVASALAADAEIQRRVRNGRLYYLVVVEVVEEVSSSCLTGVFL